MLQEYVRNDVKWKSEVEGVLYVTREELVCVESNINTQGQLYLWPYSSL
jgi:hypothetical protein